MPWSFDVGPQHGKTRPLYQVEHFRWDNKTLFRNDIALFKLERPIDLAATRRETIKACQGTHKSERLAVCGLGLVKSRKEGAKLAEHLQEVFLSETYSHCRKAEMRKHFDRNHQICAISANHDRDTCQGDSGGPMYPVDRYGTAECLYGLVSFGSRDCTGDGLYTRVSSYVPWIKSHGVPLTQGTKPKM